MLSQQAIIEFKSLYEADMGIKISHEEAIAKATEFVSFIKIFLKNTELIPNSMLKGETNNVIKINKQV